MFALEVIDKLSEESRTKYEYQLLEKYKPAPDGHRSFWMQDVVANIHSISDEELLQRLGLEWF